VDNIRGTVPTVGSRVEYMSAAEGRADAGGQVVSQSEDWPMNFCGRSVVCLVDHARANIESPGRKLRGEPPVVTPTL
jgi:hypothetical protein